MTHFVKIGNSQGIKISKNLIEKAHLEGKELNIQVVKDGLYLYQILLLKKWGELTRRKRYKINPDFFTKKEHMRITQ